MWHWPLIPLCLAFRVHSWGPLLLQLLYKPPSTLPRIITKSLFIYLLFSPLSFLADLYEENKAIFLIHVFF